MEPTPITLTNKKGGETVEYGALEFEVLHQKNKSVPDHADPVEMVEDDRNALGLSIINDLPTLLIGETGTGKTSAIRELAFLRKQGYTRINMHGYATPDDLIGSKSVKNGSTYYEQGILTKAMTEGHITVLDELNATPPDCLFIIHGLLDEDKRISLPNGDIVKPHKDFRFFATMNPDYEGTRGLNRAFIDRFSVILNVEVLKPQNETNVLMQRTGLKQEMVEKMVMLAHMGRKAYAEQKTLTFISTRSLLQWAGLVKHGLDIKKAFQTSIVNKARAEEQSAFQDFFSAVFKKSSDNNNLDMPVFTTRGEIKKKDDQLLKYEKAIKEYERIHKNEVKELEELRIESVTARTKLQNLLDNLTGTAGKQAIQEAQAVLQPSGTGGSVKVEWERYEPIGTPQEYTNADPIDLTKLAGTSHALDEKMLLKALNVLDTQEPVKRTRKKKAVEPIKNIDENPF